MATTSGTRGNSAASAACGSAPAPAPPPPTSVWPWGICWRSGDGTRTSHRTRPALQPPAHALRAPPNHGWQFEFNAVKNPAASIEWTSKEDPIGWWDGGTGAIQKPYTNCSTTSITLVDGQGNQYTRNYNTPGCPASGV
eukprot:5361955-Prymnesium_polylepis.1